MILPKSVSRGKNTTVKDKKKMSQGVHVWFTSQSEDSLSVFGFAGFGGVFTFSCRWERVDFSRYHWLTALEITYSTFNVVNTVILRHLYDFSLLIHAYIQFRQLTLIVLQICKTFQITHIKLYNFNVKATTSEKLSFSKIVCIEWKCSDVTCT